MVHGSSKLDEYMRNGKITYVCFFIASVMIPAIVVTGMVADKIRRFNENGKVHAEKAIDEDIRLTEERTMFVEINLRVTVLSVWRAGMMEYAIVQCEDGSRARIKNPIIGHGLHFLREKNGEMIEAGDMCETYLYDVSRRFGESKRKGIGLKRVRK